MVWNVRYRSSRQTEISVNGKAARFLGHTSFSVPLLPPAFWSVVIIAAVGTLILASLFRHQARLERDALFLELRAPVPATDARLALADRQGIEQTFVATADEVTHVGVGLANRRGAPNEARIQAQLYGKDQQPIASADLSVSKLHAAEPTRVPLAATLTAGEAYRVRLTTSGIRPPQALTVFYERDAAAYPPGTLRVSVRPGHSRLLPGNIGLQLIRAPTRALLMRTFSRTAEGRAAVALFLAGAGFFLFRPTRRWLHRRLADPLPFPAARLRWRDLLTYAVVGTTLAVFVTLPYYTQLSAMTTLGDVHRALVYRAVARDALLGSRSFALWEPNLCGGTPLLANAESAHADPFFLLSLVFGENLGTRLSVTATLVFSFVGAAVLAQRFAGAALLPALTAGGLFAFSGFTMLAFANGNFAWIPVGWIPWAITAYLESLRRTGAALLVGLLLAFMLLGGSIHMTVYTILALTLLAAVFAFRFRSIRPVVLLVVAGAVFLLLAAFKILPMAEAQALPTFSRPPAFIPPFSWAAKMFLDRGQLSTPQWRFALTGENFRWTEYGSYIGLAPALLFAAALPVAFRRVPWAAVSAVVTFPMIFGLPPWTILHTLPWLQEILRNPQRLRVLFLLWLGIIVSVGLTALGRRLGVWARVLVPLLVAGILLDLTTLHRTLYFGLFNLPAPALPRAEQFARVTQSYSEGAYYRAGYSTYLAHQGTLDLCIPYLRSSGDVAARALDSSNQLRPYQGEVFLTSGGRTEIVEQAANRIRVRLVPRDNGYMVLNHNFFRGWWTGGREITSHDGRLAVRVGKEDRDVTVIYRPSSFLWGSGLTVAAALITAGVILRRTRLSLGKGRAASRVTSSSGSLRSEL